MLRKRASKGRQSPSYGKLEPRSLLATIQIAIAGSTNTENVEVLFDDQVVQVIENVPGNPRASEFVTYEFETEQTPANIKIEFTNDGTVNGRDRNVRVDFVSVDGTVYESNDPSVFSTGSARPSDGCTPGFRRSEYLTCDGFFEFFVEQADVEAGLPDLDPPTDLEPSVVSSSIDGVARNAEITSSYSRLNFPAIDTPVIIAGVPSANDASPGVTQVRNVTSTGFDIRFKEWQYLDFTHELETVSWLALGEGRYATPDGSEWEVGRFFLSGNGDFGTVSFTESFENTPQVFLTVQTQNGSPVLVRANNVTSDSFDVALFEEQALAATGHLSEIVGYLAIDPAAESGIVNIGGTELPYLFETSEIGTTSESTAGFGLYLEEEQSFDQETDHAPELVNALSLGRRFFGQIVGDAELDPVTLRRTDVTEEPSLPAGFAIEEIDTDGFNLIVGIESDGQGQQYLVDQSGIIHRIVNGQRQAEPFLDIRDEVSNVNFGAGQLTGFALDPNFDSNGNIYVLYTTTVDGESFGRLTRFTRSTSNPNVIDTATARHLIGRTAETGLLAADFHSLGDIEFGEDGTLLFSWGDSASNVPTDPGHFNAQNLDVAAGKIFRINPNTGRGFATNPFFDGDFNSLQSRIWAYGIRNGYRFAVEPGSGSTSLAVGNPGRILLGDVGRDRFEELNVINRGDNLGWPFFEGVATFREGVTEGPFVFPAASFSHPSARSVTGGVFIEGDSFPTEFQGQYLVADFVVGWIRRIDVRDDGSVEEFEFGTGLSGIVDMVYDPVSGDILIAAFGGGNVFASDGGLSSGLYRLTYTG